jgi:hypothetical protein
VVEIWPIRDLIPPDHWTIAFRELDIDRPSIAQLVKALTENVISKSVISKKVRTNTRRPTPRNSPTGKS